MITKKLKNIFSISVLLLIAHGIEEYVTGFYNIDSSFSFVFQPLFDMSVPQATFLVFQIMIWIGLIVFVFLIASEKSRLWLMTIPATILILEAYHVVEALIIGGYYPGLITAVFLPIIGIFLWKELILSIKSIK